MNSHKPARLIVKGAMLGAGMILGAGAVIAWTGPTGTAPNSNVSAPINVSSTAQEKTGTLEATRFYDDNNAYYIDSNTTSVVNAISAASLTTSGNIDVAGTAYAARFYTDGNTHFPYTNGYNYLRGHTYFNGVLYDENNAGYYLDPSGNSSMNTMTNVNSIQGPGATGARLNFTGQVIHTDYNTSFNINADAWLGYKVNMPNLDNNNGSFVCWVGSNSGKLVRQAGACNTSDARLKEHIQPLQAGLAEILKLNPVTYEWKDKEIWDKGTKLGLIAQEVKEVFPEVITGTGTGVDGDWYGVDYTALVAPMIKAIQELKAENDELRARIEKLEAKN